MAYFADIAKMSTRGLKGMQRSIHDRLIEEDDLPPGSSKDYDVRGTQDWRGQADEIEAELDARKESYVKIPW